MTTAQDDYLINRALELATLASSLMTTEDRRGPNEYEELLARRRQMYLGTS